MVSATADAPCAQEMRLKGHRDVHHKRKGRSRPPTNKEPS